MATKRAVGTTNREEVIRMLAQGGDERITIDPVSGLNRYLSAPRPRNVLAYSSTTVNDLSADALLHLAELPLSPADYADRLEALRRRIRAAYALDDTAAVVFAPSGTDLEYVALACAPGGGHDGITNILLGADEVGSGCIHSAHGRHFAKCTALGVATMPGDAVAGLTGIAMVNIPVRNSLGHPFASADVASRIDEAVGAARAANRHVIAHVVHGSKTGLILPLLEDLDRLRARWGEAITWVVDACQARIDPAAIHAYLTRGVIVLMTGSKFVGAPPFCGFALVPQAFERTPVLHAMRCLFRQGEFPLDWPGIDLLEASANPGLLLRLEAAVFEIERYRRLPVELTGLVTQAFAGAVQRMVDALEIDLIPGQDAPSAGPEMDTMFALDLSSLAPGADVEDAHRWHRALVERGIRLGQPVKCMKLPDGRWGPTLRVALSMPMIVERAHELETAARRFDRELGTVAEALLDCAGPIFSAASAA